VFDRIFSKPMAWLASLGPDSRLVQVGRLAIERNWTHNTSVTQGFTERAIALQTENMMAGLTKVSSSPDPRMENRELLSEAVIEYAKLQVLLLDPYPMPDPTGFRGRPGITGELKSHLLELVDKDEYLRELLRELDSPKKLADVSDVILIRYRLMYAWTNVLQSLRLPLEDANLQDGKDWFRPYLAAICAWEEHQYRELIGMAPSLDDSDGDGGMRARTMSLFVNYVTEGVRDPLATWQERIGQLDIKLEGNIGEKDAHLEQVT
jgi:hypothetical protein